MWLAIIHFAARTGNHLHMILQAAGVSHFSYLIHLPIEEFYLVYLSCPSLLFFLVVIEWCFNAILYSISLDGCMVDHFFSPSFWQVVRVYKSSLFLPLQQAFVKRLWLSLHYLITSEPAMYVLYSILNYCESAIGLF